MKHYYFDLRDGDALATDEEGIDLPDIETVQVEAAKSLADMAQDSVRCRATNLSGHRMAIEVRDTEGLISSHSRLSGTDTETGTARCGAGLHYNRASNISAGEEYALIAQFYREHL